MPKEGVETDGLQELVALAALPRRVEVYTLDPETDAPIPRTVRVAPMTFDICAELAAAVRPIVEDIGPTIEMAQLPQIMADHAKSVRAIVATATQQPPEYIGSLPLDQVAILATAVFEVNFDFFVRRVGPTFRKLAAKMFGAGPTPSTSSPSTGT